MVLRGMVPQFLASLIMFSGCATTGDPPQFGWSPSKAGQCAAGYRAELRHEEGYLQSERSSARSLNRQERELRGRIDAAHAELGLMLSDVQKIETSGDPALVDRAAATRGKIQSVQSSTNPGNEEVRALRREVELLREEMHLLQQR